MEHVLDRPRPSARGEPAQIVAEVLTLVADVDTGVPASFRFLFSDHRPRPCHLGAAGDELAASIKPVHFHEHEALLERGSRPCTDALLDETKSIAVDGEQP